MKMKAHSAELQKQIHIESKRNKVLDDQISQVKKVGQMSNKHPCDLRDLTAKRFVAANPVATPTPTPTQRTTNNVSMSMKMSME